MSELTQLTPLALYASMNAVRHDRGISWRQVAREAGCSASTLSRMPNRSPSMAGFLLMVKWLIDNHGIEPCAHDGAIVAGGIGTLAQPPTDRLFCLQCGQEVPQ